MKTETTGQLIVAYSGPGLTEIIIARDMGHYNNTIEELNVRKLDVIERYSVLACGEVMREITSRAGYGCGWSETSHLYPISEAEAEQIRAELTRTNPVTPNEPTKPSPMDKMLCPLCHTVCYGDCQSR